MYGFDLDSFGYINTTKKFTLICPTHGPIIKTFSSLVYKKRGCSHCTDGFFERKTTEDFITEATHIHGGRYTYQNVIYTGAFGVVNITCKTHGDYPQVAREHLSGKGCSDCVGGVLLTATDFITSAEKTHGKRYDYSLVEYVNNNTPVTIICHKHGPFLQTPKVHKLGSGCSRCSNRMSQPEFDIITFIQSLDIGVIHGDWDTIPPQEIDIVIPSLQIGIEYCGLYWHSSAKEKPVDYHVDKLNAANNASYELITLFEDEWLNSPDGVRDKLLNLIQPHEYLNVTVRGVKTTDGYNIIANSNGEIVGGMDVICKNGDYSIKNWSGQYNVFDKMLDHIENHTTIDNLRHTIDRTWESLSMYPRFIHISTIPPTKWYTKRQQKTRTPETGGGVFDLWDCGYLEIEWRKS